MITPSAPAWHATCIIGEARQSLSDRENHHRFSKDGAVAEYYARLGLRVSGLKVVKQDALSPCHGKAWIHRLHHRACVLEILSRDSGADVSLLS